MGVARRRRRWLWRWRRNPLRRRVDVLEGLVGLVVAVVLVCGVPAAGVGVALALGDDLGRTARLQGAQRHTTTAVLLRDAHAVSDAGMGLVTYRRVPVRWVGADGLSRTGAARVRPGLAAGAKVAVWVDSGERLTEAPMTAVRVWSLAGVAGLACAALAAAAVLFARSRVLGWLRRRALREWARSWARVEPLWSRGRR